MKRWAKHVINMDKMKNGHKTLFGKPEGNKSLVRSRWRQGFNLLKCSA